MAVKIRLKRMGAKKKPFYRIIVADARSSRDGKFIEELGYYNPLTDPSEIKVDVEKAQKWIANGAQPTDTVRALLKKAGVEKLPASPKAPKAPKSPKAPKAAVEAEAEAAVEVAEATEEAAEAVEEAVEAVEEAPAQATEEAPAEESPAQAEE